MIECSSINIIYKLLKNKEPKSLIKLYKAPSNPRKSSRWYPIYQPKSINMQNFIIYKSIKLFYLLPNELQNVKESQFKIKLKTHYINAKIDTFDTND